jgi:hypothetical protein
MEATMKEPWSSRWYWSLLLAVASMLGLMLIVVMIVDAFAEHAPQPGSQASWQTHLQSLEDALARNDLKSAELRWSQAYAAALRSRHWEGLVAVADAYRRLGARGGFLEIAVAKARQTYLAALFRARSEMSLEGVLQAARGFVELGDEAVVEQCLQVARLVAAETKDPRADARVRAFTERWLTATGRESSNHHSELPTDLRQRRPGGTR